MPENILEKIINKKRNRIQILKKDISISSLNDKISQIKNYVNFKEKILNNINDEIILFLNSSIFINSSSLSWSILFFSLQESLICLFRLSILVNGLNNLIRF